MKFLRCKKCGQIVEVIEETGNPVVCCGEQMEELIPKHQEDGLTEKHVPVYKTCFGMALVAIGSIRHPMTTTHYIEWIVLITDKGSQRKYLKPGDAPFVTFALDGKEKVIAIYAYCNLHQLWELKCDV